MSNFMDDIDAFTKHLEEHKWDCIPDQLIVFDLETTGLTPRTDRILEIGAILFKKDLYLKTGEVENFQCFIKQNLPIPEDAISIHGITNEMVKDGDTEYSALTQFFSFSKGLPIYAYNAKFDRDFIIETAKRCGYYDKNFTFHVEDIMDCVETAIDDLPNKKLVTVAKHLGYSIESAHRALQDCSLALAVLIKCQQSLMIKQSTLLREEYLEIKSQTEELKSKNNLEKETSPSSSFLKTVGIALTIVIISLLIFLKK